MRPARRPEHAAQLKAGRKIHHPRGNKAVRDKKVGIAPVELNIKVVGGHGTAALGGDPEGEVGLQQVIRASGIRVVCLHLKPLREALVQRQNQRIVFAVIPGPVGSLERPAIGRDGRADSSRFEGKVGNADSQYVEDPAVNIRGTHGEPAPQLALETYGKRSVVWSPKGTRDANLVLKATGDVLPEKCG